MPIITFQPSGKSVDVPAGTPLVDACRRAGFVIPTPCGGKGLCGKCRVKVLKGEIAVDGRQQDCLSDALLSEGWRAACIVACAGDLVLADPENQHAGVVLTDFAGRQAEPGKSGIWQADAVMAAPAKEDQQNDLDRLLAALRAAGVLNANELVFDAGLLSRLPGILRKTKYRCRVVGLDKRVLAVRGLDEDGPAPNLGLAVDLGTTTMAAALCDLDNGTVLAVASRANPQSLHGDDVITRMDYAGRGREQLDEMRRLVVAAIHELSDEARREAGVAGDILLLAVGGNTVMNHMLLGVDPGALAVSPFIPCFRSLPPLSAAEAGWPAPAPLLLVVPNVAAYVGGDITAGVLAHDVDAQDGITLFLDVGTNGEIVLAVDSRMYACAAAAGPAFEGARISQGMRASPGAISRVDATADGVDIRVVGDGVPARGVCGTGLLDAVAALLDLGVVDEGGRMLDNDEAEEELGLSREVLSLLHEDEDGPAFRLAPSSDGGPGVALTQRDVREFQLAKGAVAAGVKVLLGVAGVKPEDVDRVYLAGGFGSYLRPESALRVGLLPEDIPVDRVHSVGNASLAGTRLFLLSAGDRSRAGGISAGVEYVELSGREDFQIAFAEEMLFPG